ncbi:MAG TPA: sugar phosphate isomerase/epimerase [Candidatus Limnocylindria bacterium]|nr:sugar phosphate isomerase/epimerase [Candidatus Limnocylindria bacterium]
MKSPTLLALTCSASLAVALFTGCSTSKSVGTGASFKGPIGLQLYSLRGDFAKDVPGTMAKVKDFGIKYVELAGTYNMPPEQFLALLESNQLKAISGHFNFDMYRTNAHAVAHQAEALGLKYAGCAWIPHTGDFDEKEARAAAEVFNNAGKILAEHGIKFFYHTHGYEFQPHGNGTLFDLIMAETDPRLVSYEMDIFWIVHPNQDPVKLLEKYDRRFELMHVKDMKQGTPRNLTGKSDVNNDVQLGTGVMEWPGILAAAKKAGVKWYFIEDEADAAAQHIPGSLKFLEGAKF